ncbi:MAG TPA: HDOD domain-containing protein [Phycisphaerales bacterium]|nr:HDOD domain-containing protein [Phycisphaerales bacterium]
MPSENHAVARQVELILRRLDSLSTLPEVAAGFLPHLAEGRVNAPALSEIIEADPALTAQILSLAQERGLRFEADPPSVAEAVAKLPDAVVRDAVLSVKVFQVFDADYNPERQRPLSRKQLALHALAVACAAGHIAEFVLPEPQRPLAFSAGLLCDIGKLALDEVMPKSLAKIVGEARQRNLSLSAVARQQLGIDHVVVAKRLAEKWALPEDLVLAVWLHNSDAEVLAADLPRTRIALVVHLASLLARQCGIGDGGDADPVPDPRAAARHLGLGDDQLDAVRNALPERVEAKSRMLGLDLPGAMGVYCDRIATTAADLSRQHGTLTQQSHSFAADAGQLAFLREFVLSVRPAMSAIEVAASFARAFRRHYQADLVGLYLQIAPNDLFLDWVAVDAAGTLHTALVQRPADAPAVPPALQRDFAIVDAAQAVPWLLEQAGLELAEARMAPLHIEGRAIGAIVFQDRIPVDQPEQTASLKIAAAVAAQIIGMKFAMQKQARLAERFAELLNQLRDTQTEMAAVDAFSGIAEMAAGAAHELNNPLAVISGRAQLLLETEADEDRKQMLRQIQERTEDISRTLEDLMTFARPNPPQAGTIGLRALCDQAVEQLRRQESRDFVEVTFEDIEGLGDVHVDAGQIATALAHVLANALQSYKGGSGPITIRAAAHQPTDAAAFVVADQGCGMTPETQSRAFDPFFSDCPAGRRRGMGLAHARRLIRLNRGTIALDSQPDQGTRVTITLPRT